MRPLQIPFFCVFIAHSQTQPFLMNCVLLGKPHLGSHLYPEKRENCMTLTSQCPRPGITDDFFSCEQYLGKPPQMQVYLREHDKSSPQIISGWQIQKLNFDIKGGYQPGPRPPWRGGTFDWWWYPLLSRVKQITWVFFGGGGVKSSNSPCESF